MAPLPQQTPLESTGEITEKYKEIVRSNGIKDTVSEVIIKDAGLRGEGFASLTQCVTVKFENPRKEPLNLFVKVLTDSPSHTKLLTEMKSFEKEGAFLVEYVNAAKEMCKSKGREGFIDFYPKCYYADDKMIVLENLVLDKGYSLENKEERQDLETAKCGIKTLAKHHAIGYVMIKEHGGPDKFFKKFPDFQFEAFFSSFMALMMAPSFETSISSNVKILEKNDIKGAKEAAARLKSFSGKIIGIIQDSLKSHDANSFLTLGHGDYWNNNMMFLKDKDTQKIVHHMAIDLQCIRYNSPLIDVGYYFFTSVKPPVRQGHLREMLELYKDTVNSVTEDFGHPINLTYEEVFMDFRKTVGYGFWSGLMMAVGPGMALLKDVDISKVEMSEFPELMTRLVNKWIDENPEKGAETAEELVKIIQEYDELML